MLCIYSARSVSVLSVIYTKESYFKLQGVTPSTWSSRWHLSGVLRNMDSSMQIRFRLTNFFVFKSCERSLLIPLFALLLENMARHIIWVVLFLYHALDMFIKISYRNPQFKVSGFGWELHEIKSVKPIWIYHQTSKCVRSLVSRRARNEIEKVAGQIDGEDTNDIGVARKIIKRTKIKIINSGCEINRNGPRYTILTP